MILNDFSSINLNNLWTLGVLEVWVFMGIILFKKYIKIKRRQFPTSLQYFPLNNVLYVSKIPKVKRNSEGGQNGRPHRPFHSSSNFQISRNNGNNNWRQNNLCLLVVL